MSVSSVSMYILVYITWLTALQPLEELDVDGPPQSDIIPPPPMDVLSFPSSPPEFVEVNIQLVFYWTNSIQIFAIISCVFLVAQRGTLIL